MINKDNDQVPGQIQDIKEKKSVWFLKGHLRLIMNCTCDVLDCLGLRVTSEKTRDMFLINSPFGVITTCTGADVFSAAWYHFPQLCCIHALTLHE